MTKEFYQLRKEDFIPIIGLKDYTDRCLKECDNHPILGLSDWYASKCGVRDVGLTLYNTSIIGGAIVGVSGLVELLSK